MKHILETGNCRSLRNHWSADFGILEGMGKKLSLPNPALSEMKDSWS